MGRFNKAKRAKSEHQGEKKKRVNKSHSTSSAVPNDVVARNLQRVRKRGKKKKTLSDYTTRLSGSSFRMLNERLYCDSPETSFSFFQNNPASFRLYHEGFREQVTSWPLNPVDVCIKSILENHRADEVIIDCGCGEGKLALSVPNPTRSFDLVALQPHVEVANMTALPVPNGYADAIVFSLSLMSPQLTAILEEANRVLKVGGLLKIAEVRSRIENEQDKQAKEEDLEVKEGEERKKQSKEQDGGKKRGRGRGRGRGRKRREEEEGEEGEQKEGMGYDLWDTRIQQLGFQLVERTMLSPMFVWMQYRKKKETKQQANMPSISLQPCIYKRR